MKPRSHVVALSIIAAVCAGCPPSAPPRPGAASPSVDWGVLNPDTNTSTSLPSGSTFHIDNSRYNITFRAADPTGIASMNVTGQGNPECVADNGSGGIFSGGHHPVTLAPQSSVNNPPATPAFLFVVPLPFDFYAIDCGTTVRTDHGPKEGTANSGIFTLTGVATNGGGGTSTATLVITP
jgi:hypothetical protein